jgi:hypothetical protein
VSTNPEVENAGRKTGLCTSPWTFSTYVRSVVVRHSNKCDVFCTLPEVDDVEVSKTKGRQKTGVGHTLERLRAKRQERSC